MSFFGRTDKQESSEKNKLSENSTIQEWLDHPVGGKIFREMLASAGQNEKVLSPVRSWSLKRVAKMSRGKMTDDMIADMVQRANVPAGSDSEELQDVQEVASEKSEPQTAAAPEEVEWTERITPERFAGKTVVVTGAGSGIGRACAARIVKEGGRVIAVDISSERLEQLKEEFSDASLELVAGDITDDAAIEKIMTASGDTIDALANVAGVMDNMTPVHEVTDEVWNRVMNINLLGTMKLMRAVIPGMLKRQAGSIVNITSEAGLRGSAAGAAYTTSKHAVIGLTKNAAFSYTSTGIRVNAIAPGGVATNIEASFDSELFLERFGLASSAMPAPTTPEALAASITFLLSDDGVNINGAILPSDGGWSAV